MAEKRANGYANQIGFWIEYRLREAIRRDELENWQSEFLQLMLQVAALAFPFYLSSPQSKEGDERKEEKLDKILALIDPENAGGHH